MAEAISDNAREARNEYQRKWRAKHKDRLREYAVHYWERKAEKMAGKGGADSERKELEARED